MTFGGRGCGERARALHVVAASRRSAHSLKLFTGQRGDARKRNSVVKHVSYLITVGASGTAYL